MSTLNLQSSTVKNYAQRGGLVYVFSTAGVDVFRLADWTRVAWASFTNVTCGAVNNNAVYLGTSDRGVYALPLGLLGDMTPYITQAHNTTDAGGTILSDAITGLQGRKQKLLITTDAGAHFLPAPLVVYNYDDGTGCSSPAIGNSKIAYITGDGKIYTLAHPTADWTSGDAAEAQNLDGYSLSFDGDDDIVTCPAPTSGVLTFETWVYVASSTDGVYDTIFIANDQVAPDRVRFFCYNAPWTFHIEIGGTALSLNVGVTLNQWVHYALVVDPGNTAYLYENGEIADSGDCPPGTPDWPAILNIGHPPAFYNRPNDGFDGQIREFRIWDTARTQQQIQDNMTAALTGNESGLVALYNFVDGSGGTLTDSAGSNDGTISGATWTGLYSGLDGAPQAAAYGAGDVLFIASDEGLNIYSGSNINSVAAATAADATSISTTVGTPTGILAATQNQDGIYYHVDEVNESPGFTVTADFANVLTAATNLNIYGRYDGNSGHTVNVEVWRYDTSQWEILGQLTDSATDALHTFALTDARHREGNLVQMRINHVSSGNTSHDLYIDHLYLDITPATVNDMRGVWPQSTATDTTGKVAIGVSDDADGGRCEIYSIDNDTAYFGNAGDTERLFMSDDFHSLICAETLTRIGSIDYRQPQPGARGVRRDWTLYAEVTDILDGIASATLKINSQTVSHDESAISDGLAVTFTPGTQSGYGAKVTAELTVVDGDDDTLVYSWSWTTELPPALDKSYSTPPNVICVRDIGLTAAEADETVNSTNVVWIDDMVSPLIVSDAQAESVGAVIIDNLTWHRHLSTVRVLPLDDAAFESVDLQRGDIVTITATALGMTSQKCEVLGVQHTASRSDDEDLSSVLTVAWYEEV